MKKKKQSRNWPFKTAAKKYDNLQETCGEFGVGCKFERKIVCFIFFFRFNKLVKVDNHFIASTFNDITMPRCFSAVDSFENVLISLILQGIRISTSI